MPHLTNCVNCGHQVSSEATTCPGCGRHPHPHRPYQSPRPDNYDQDEYTCPVCRTVLSPETFRFEFTSVMGGGSESIVTPVHCPKCGQPVKVTRCACCGRGIFEGTGKSVLRPGGYVSYHSSCFPLIPEKSRRDERDKKCSSGEGCSTPVLLALALALLVGVFALAG